MPCRPKKGVELSRENVRGNIWGFMSKGNVGSSCAIERFLWQAVVEPVAVQRRTCYMYHVHVDVAK